MSVRITPSNANDATIVAAMTEAVRTRRARGGAGSATSSGSSASAGAVSAVSGEGWATGFTSSVQGRFGPTDRRRPGPSPGSGGRRSVPYQPRAPGSRGLAREGADRSSGQA
jgi:hypothetical protein